MENQNAVSQAVNAELDWTGHLLNNLKDVALARGMDWITAILIFIIGYIICRYIRRGARHLLERSNVDPSARSFISEIIFFFFLAIVVLFALGTAGFNAGALAAAFGGIGLAIALGLKDNIGNVASGIFILIFKPFRVGDYIKTSAGEGTVKDIRIMYTVLSTLGNQMIVIPNSALISSPIKNYSYNDVRNLEYTFGVGYDTDLRSCLSLLREIFSESPYVLDKEGITIYISEMAASSINIYARAPVDRTKFYEAQNEIYIAVKAAFDREGIDIPFPQLVIHTAPDKLSS